MDNLQAARTIFSLASLLESQGANPYRVRAYRRAAFGMLVLPEQVNRYTTTDQELDLPWLGPRLRRKLGELVTRGRMQFYDDLIAELPRAQRELLSLPGVGPKTAQRLIDELGIRSIRGLVRAARRGRLRRVRGIGRLRERRLAQAAEAMVAGAA